MKKKSRIITLVLAAVLVLAGVMAAAIFLSTPKDEAKDLSAEEIREQEWFDAAFATHEIESKYTFIGTQEEKLTKLDDLRAEVEILFAEMIDAGTLASYDKGLFSYDLYLPNGTVYVYNLPYTIEGFLGGNGGSGLLISPNPNSQQANRASGEGKVLVIDTCSNQSISPNVLKQSGSYITRSDLNYSMTYYGESDCNNIEKLYSMLTSLDQYDVIILEGHGENSQNPNKSTKIYVAGNVPFAEYEAFMKKHPQWDFTKDENTKLAGLKIGAATYKFATGKETELQKKYTKNGKVIDTLSVEIDADTVDALYADGSFKDTIVYLGCCFGAQNDVLPTAFLDKGARAVMVYKNLLSPEYHADIAPYIFSRLPEIEYDSGELWAVQDAVEKAKETYGELDPTYADDSILKKLMGQYEEEGVRCFIKLYTKDNAEVRMVDYSQVPSQDDSWAEDEGSQQMPSQDMSQNQSQNQGPSTGDNSGSQEGGETDLHLNERLIVDLDMNKYNDHFASFAEGGKTYLSVEELIAEDELYQQTLARLKAEGSEPMQTVLSSCMNLFYIVSCNNGYFASYSDYVSNQKYVDIGTSYMTDIIGSYKKNGSVGYYAVVYIGGHYSGPKNAMAKFMNAMDIRNADATPYTLVEQDAIELCKMYLTTFYNHRDGIEGVASTLLAYTESVKKNDMNRMLLGHYKASYAQAIQNYYDTLALLENYFK